MKRMLKGLLTVVMLFSIGAMMASCSSSGSSTSGTSCDSCTTCDCTSCSDCCGCGSPLFLMRSHSVNAARDIVGWQTLINRFEMEKIYGAFAITPEYSRSFKPCRIANYFFGPAMENGVMTISGSKKGVTDQTTGVGATIRGPKELLADHFGLPTNFVSNVSFKPRIQNFMLDLNLYLGLDELWEGGFFIIHAPIAWTKWCLNPCETVVTTGTYGYDAGYMNNAAVANTALETTWLNVMDGGHTFGDMKEALKYGKISNCCLTKWRLSDIQIALGWNFLTDEDYHFGLMIRGAFPTGNRPCSEYLFEPIVGNGRHWELGGGLTSHACLWTSDDEESTFSVYLDANVTHLFKDKQYRVFDFTDKPLSRYALISELGTPVTNLYTGATASADNPPLSAQYKSNLFHAINKTTCCTDVSIAVQGDLAIKFAYMNGNFTFDLGYNLWGRSGEKFGSDCCSDCCLTANTYALKGDAFVYGFGASNAGTEAIRNEAIPLSATESKSDIFGGTNTAVGSAFANADRLNPNVDNAQFAWGEASANPSDALQLSTGAYNIANNQRTSSTPKYVNCDDLNICKGPSALSHKIFAHVGYIWHDDEEEDEWVPFLGIGGEAEFGSKSNDNYGAVSQWGVWLKGGLAFN